MTKFKCQYCGKEYKKEGFFEKHLGKCTMKKRYMVKDEKSSYLAFILFFEWNKQYAGTEKLFEDFVVSKFYIAFINFAEFLLNENIEDSIDFMRWLTDNDIGIDKWAKRSNYETYVLNLYKRETVERALEKYVYNAIKWAKENNCNWADYALEASDNRLMSDIRLYKISPWIIFCYDPFIHRVESMPDEYVEEIGHIVDIPYWNKKFLVNKSSVKFVKEVLPL